MTYDGRVLHQPDKIRVLVVDDHQIVRDGIFLALRDEPDLEVVGSAEDAEQALKRVAELRPDIVLMDVSLPGQNGLDATVQLKAMYPKVKVVILTVHDNDLYLAKALKSGASGYLLKDAPSRLIPQSLRAIVLGSTVLPSSLVGGLVENHSSRPLQCKLEEFGLTPRELDVLALIAEGFTNRCIADKLKLAEGTVKKYVQTLISKLNCRDRAHAAVTATRAGLLD